MLFPIEFQQVHAVFDLLETSLETRNTPCVDGGWNQLAIFSIVTGQFKITVLPVRN